MIMELNINDDVEYVVTNTYRIDTMVVRRRYGCSSHSLRKVLKVSIKCITRWAKYF